MAKITIEFNSFEEFDAFRGSHAGPAIEGPRTEIVEPEKPKRTRAKKDEPVVTPEPEQPPADVPASTQGNPFPMPETAANPFTAPAVAEPTAVEKLVVRIGTRIDAVIKQGQPEEAMTTWFRSQIGADAANANMTQIKGALLAKLSETQLEGIAKLIGA